ncbi:L,D-transpeptidase family protein [Pelagibacterium montanilacus]|uniref:L,D-transpeptidase family protein n=1 Tax=Pelagibacterium montanilacus TaxID=2185280 RepID=UPI0013DF0A89|nr:L,D-transpeptidase family protein [Pelagibacterium montanilacus]
MLRISVFALFAAMALAAPQASATTLETVTVGSVEATRIVISPPRNDLAKAIRSDLRAAVDAAPQGSRAQTEARELYYFYGARHFEPLWLTESQTGSAEFTDAAHEVIALFENAHLEGLDPDDYLTDALVSDFNGELADLTTLEAEFSAAMVRYAQDAYSGRLDPRSVTRNFDIATKRVDEAELLANLAGSANPAAVLASYHPDHREFQALRALLAEHYAGEAEEPIIVPGGTMLRPGMSDPRVPVLRERLSVAAPIGEDAAPELYDEPLADAIRAFQGSMNLTVDGVVGPATLQALNGQQGASVGQIVANMERWRWMPEDLGEFHVLVNIPEYHLEVNKFGKTIWDTKVIVGNQTRQTPVFSDEIRHVVTNPYWNVPPTIMREDVMPRVVANPGYLASQNMEALYGGRVIDAWSVDWSQVSPGQVRVRQRPGSSNALGRVKFLFPNTHHVYLHDTNAPGLFSRSARAISSGCVRVEDPFGFAEALLEFESNFTVASLENSLGSNERWFNMDRRVPVHLAYFTVRVGEDGSVRSYGDVYGHEATMIDMLGL